MQGRDPTVLLIAEREHLARGCLGAASGDVGVLLRHVLDAEIAEVDRALDGLGAGTYGWCEARGKPIDGARLRAVLAIRRCVDDQHDAEAEERDDELQSVEAAEEQAMHVVSGR